jgi:hypothetical protein
MLLDASQIFETPWPVFTVAIIVLAVVVLVRQTWPDKRRWWQLVIPLVLGIGAFGLDYFFDTDYEKIESVINSGIQAVIDQDLNQIDKIISADYSDSRHRSKVALMSYCRDLLAQPFVTRIKKQQELVTISAPTAVVELSVRLHLHPQNVYTATANIMYVKVKFDLAKTPSGNWLISRTEIIAVNYQPMGWQDV